MISLSSPLFQCLIFLPQAITSGLSVLFREVSEMVMTLMAAGIGCAELKENRATDKISKVSE